MTTLKWLAALVFGLGGASVLDAQKIPLELPFAVDREGSSAETLFQVREDAFYAVNLSFLYDEDAPARSDRNRVWHLVGGAENDPKTDEPRTPGAPLELELSLQRSEKEADTEVLRERVIRPRLSSWGSGALTARLAAIRLAPGRYHLVVRNAHAAPTLRDVRARIELVRAYMGK